MTAEQAEQAVVSANKRKQRESYLREVRDSGAVVVDLPATCGAAADACAGVYVPHDTSKKGLPKNSRARTFRHEEGVRRSVDARSQRTLERSIEVVRIREGFDGSLFC